MPPLSPWSSSKIILLPASSCKTLQAPLEVAVLVVEQPPTDLEQLHSEAGTDFRKLNRVVRRSHKHEVPDLDGIVDILEGNHTAGHLRSARGRISRRKDVFQYLAHPLAELAGEALEYEVWIRLGHGS